MNPHGPASSSVPMIRLKFPARSVAASLIVYVPPDKGGTENEPVP